MPVSIQQVISARITNFPERVLALPFVGQTW